MASAASQDHERASEVPDKEPPPELLQDPRWQLAERIADSEPFQKSTRLPRLLLYLAHHTITGDRHKLTEQMIGQAVFDKGLHYNPAADSSVRVYVRQLRLKLHEYYHSYGLHEELIVSVPKGGYALEFTPAASLHPADTPAVESGTSNQAASSFNLRNLFGGLAALFFMLALICSIGWYRAVASRSSTIPWPLSSVVHKGSPTTLVIADAGFALRMLGNDEVSLDNYIDHSYLQPLLPKHMSPGEASLLHYFDSTRITSEADAHAAAVLSSLAAPNSDNLIIRSSRDINANDLTHGDFIFVGSKTSNPWVELLDERMNFQLVENGPHGSRYLVNRHPAPGEQSVYATGSMGTLASGDDYAVIALLPAKTGSGSMLLLEGVRMEGTNAAIALLQSEAGRSKLQSRLAALNGGRTPQYFEALLHAQSVAGATISVDVIAARAFQ